MANSSVTQALEALRKNFAALKNVNGFTDAKLGELTGAAPKSLNNLRHERHSVGVHLVIKAAVALGVEPWQIFIENLPTDPKLTKDLKKLVRAFLLSDDEGRKQILFAAVTACQHQGIYEEVFGRRAEAGSRAIAPGKSERLKSL